jgi:hypothetical protein
MNETRILVVDDEEDLCEILKFYKCIYNRLLLNI